MVNILNILGAPQKLISLIKSMENVAKFEKDLYRVSTLLYLICFASLETRFENDIVYYIIMQQILKICTESVLKRVANDTFSITVENRN